LRLQSAKKKEGEFDRMNRMDRMTGEEQPS
jgi:hypothetical protein